MKVNADTDPHFRSVASITQGTQVLGLQHQQDYGGRVLIFSAGLAFIVSVGLTWGFIRWMRKVELGQYVRQYGPDIHMHKQGTPTMGGVVFVAITSVFFLFQPNISSAGWFVLSAMLLFASIGLVDDLLKFFWKDAKGLKARYKFLLQGVATLVLFLGFQAGSHTLFLPGLEIGFSLEGIALLVWLYLLFSGTTHAFNLTDGLDGLASGIGVIALGALGIIAAWQGQLDIVFLILIFTFTLLGFLWFNRHPAQLFMGDTGSFAIGGLVAAIAFSMGLELYLFLFALVPVLETLSVAVQLAFYHFTQKRIFKIAPFHHHFEAARGVDYKYLLPTIEWPEQRVTLTFWFTATVGASLGLVLYFA